MKASIYTSGKWHIGSGPTSLMLARVYRDDFALSLGGAQKYSGKIIKMDNDSILSFQLADVEPLGEFAQVGRRFEGVMIDGVGSIVDWRVKEVEEGANSRTWFLTIDHDVNNNTADKVTVTYILAENSIIMPSRIQFNRGEKFWVEGTLESLGNNPDSMVVQATQAILFQAA
ncbi:hypothetical protein PGTUg99_001830 [Puccinia graminis f. sp. tritici]|uniref:Uncharacterized protein n=1 Tax=Puccinia graminis f. sp. tritici TaxID=56615 RepID=A0A5B0S4S6_PUCGR|nr:hypothetical protein PGTUg99_001830 [Puccinia graminis f. sp. tritici]